MKSHTQTAFRGMRHEAGDIMYPWSAFPCCYFTQFHLFHVSSLEKEHPLNISFFIIPLNEDCLGIMHAFTGTYNSLFWHKGQDKQHTCSSFPLGQF